MRTHTFLPLMVMGILLLCLMTAAQASTVTINYTLPSAARVSMNIYDAGGKVVRELLHAAQRPAGAQTEIWDGLDSFGNTLPAGGYSWKILCTQGLQAEYLQQLGSSYVPCGAPGTHGGAGAVTVGDGGVYIGANGTENIEPVLLKQTLDGATVYWGAGAPEAWQAARSLASANGTLYMLASNGKIWTHDATNGTRGGGYSVAWAGDTESFPYDMDCYGTTLVVSYPNHNAIRWYNPATGALLDTATVTAPQGVTVAADGTVYVTTGTKVVKLTSANHTLVDVVTGLTSPRALDIDHSNGNILVVQVGASQQVKRFSSAGALLNTYGQAGGRGDGLYTAAMQQSFYDPTDVAADGNGGFLVAEPNYAPRRVAYLQGNGTLIREWYGGTVWAPWISPEPDNPNVGWMASAWNSMIRMTLNHTTNTWQVHSIYSFAGLASGLINGHDNAEIWEVRKHNGTTYLCRLSTPCVVKVDEVNWRLIPVVVSDGNIGHEGQNKPQFIKDWAGANNAYLWTDQDGDGIPQQQEVTFSPNGPATALAYVDDACNYYQLAGSPYIVQRHEVTGWNAAGAPVYGHFPYGEAAVAALPPRVQNIEGRWGSYFYHDVNTNDLFGAFNSNMQGLGLSWDSFLTKFDSSGNEWWTVGSKGNAPGCVANAFRRFAGRAHGCLVLLDNDGGWSGIWGPTYVWDSDGLWVGGLFENPDLTTVPASYYRLCGENLAGTLYTNPTTGETLFFGSWENDGRVYRITGWDSFTRQNGTVTLASPSTPNTGTGLRAEYYDNADLTNSKSVRVDANVNFNWGANIPSGTGITSASSYSTRWSGKVVSTYGPQYYGAWTQYFNANEGPAPDYHNSSHQSGNGGAYCEYKFKGTSIIVKGRLRYDYGQADIYMDGVFRQTIDTYSAADTYQATLYTESGLADTEHTLRVVVKGTKNPSSTAYYVYLDYFVVNGINVDDIGEKYTFYVNSKDGARLWVDGHLVVMDWKEKGAASETSGAVTLAPGAHQVWLEYFKNTGSSTVGLSWSSVSLAKQIVPQSQLYPNIDHFAGMRTTNANIPGVIECENFDSGGEGVAYHDTDTSNLIQVGSWPEYRRCEGVDIQAKSFVYDESVARLSPGDYQVEASAGEWLKYTVTAETTANYTLAVRVTTGNASHVGGLFHVEVDGVDVTGPLAVPMCTYTAPFATVTTSVNLTSGVHALKLVFGTNGSYVTGKFDALEFTEAKAATPTFSPAPGVYATTQTVAISCLHAGATIRYTTDGSTPSPTNGTVYTAPVPISVNITLKAIAYNVSGLPNSNVASGTYVIGSPNFFNVLYSGSRNNFTGNVGYEFTPSSNLTVYALGRAVSGAMNQYHAIKIWKVSDQSLVGTANVMPTSPTDSLGYKYTILPTPISLSSGTAYRITSYEMMGGDAWMHVGGISNHSALATISKPVYAGGDVYPSGIDGGAEQGYVPPTFYASVNVAGTNFFNALYTGTRNDFTGNVGFEFTPSSNLTVSALGRAVSGTMTQNHAVKIWKVSDQSLVASATVTPASSTDSLGYMYVTLPTAVILSSGTAYRITSYETYSGDTWRHIGGISNHSALAAISKAVYAGGDVYPASIEGGAEQGYVPPTFYTITTTQVEAPTFTPAAGSYSTAQSVTISTTTSGATIRYTTDGSTPSQSNGTVYSTPVAISTTTTLKAIAYKSGMSDSAVTSGTYTITASTATNFFNVLYTGSRNDFAGNIGFEFTPSSNLTVSALGRPVSGTMTQNHAVKIWKVSDQSLVASATVTPASPTDSLGYKYTTLPNAVTLSSGTVYRITSNEFYGGDAWMHIGGISNHSAIATISRAVYTAADIYPESVSGGAEQGYVPPTFYTISATQVATPTFSPAAGTYSSAQSVTISTATSGATIRYTTDGSTPSQTNGTVYSAAVAVNYSATLKAIAYKSDMADSVVATSAYRLNLKLSGTIIGTLGSYGGSGSIRENAFDGSTGTFFSGPTADGCWVGLDLGNGATASKQITKIRYYPRAGWASRMVGGKFQGSNTADFSSGVTDLHTISATPPAAWTDVTTIGSSAGFRYVRYLSPAGSYGDVAEIEFHGDDLLTASTVFTPAGGNYFSWQSVALSSATPGATIRYTTDGSTPSQANGTVYSSPISVSNSTLKAIAYRYNIPDSGVTTATYTINTDPKLTGTVIGTTGSWNNDPNLTRDKAVDGNTGTYFSGPTANGCWVGLDLGSGVSKVISGIRYYPRAGQASRMVGGKFQGSTTADFSSGVTDLYTITSTPPTAWTDVNAVASGTAFRYLRYLSPAGSYSDVAEIEFYGHN